MRRTSSALIRAWWMRSGFTAPQVQRHGRHGGDRAGQAHQGPRSVERHGLVSQGDRHVDVGSGGGHL